MLGFVNIYKPKGVTSFKIVGEIKRIYGIKRVGHLGTLDPMAEGVLPIAIGKATKFFDYFLGKDKEYVGEFKAGVETDTLDAEGEVSYTTDVIPKLEEVQKKCEEFTGKIKQTPPKFSAIKINGQRAYKLAREGKDFGIEPKEVNIYRLSAEKSSDDNLFKLNIWCSAGTYIRSLGNDIFKSLGSTATMVKLVRTRSGSFNINQSKTIDEVVKNPKDAIITIEQALPNIQTIELNDNQFLKVKNGMVQKFDIEDGDYLARYLGDTIALVEVKDCNLKCKINLIEEKHE